MLGLGYPRATVSTAKHTLLQRVLENRRDDDARRVYADWLSSRGDPRGEFIHLQLDRAQGRGGLGKLERELNLLDEHRERWTKPLGTLASHVVFERGFPTCVELDLNRGAELLPQLAGNLAWGSVEELFVRNPRAPVPTNVLAPLIDAPHMRELTRLAAPIEMLLALAEPRLRYWRAVTVLTWNWSRAGVLDLCGHLPRVTQLGVITSYADDVGSLCALAPLAGRVAGLEIFWDGNAHAPSDFSSVFEVVEVSAFESLHWVDTAGSVELFMSRRSQSGRWSLAGDVYAIYETVEAQTAALCDEVTLYWDAEVDEADYKSVRELFEGVGATVQIEIPTRTRWLPLS